MRVIVFGGAGDMGSQAVEDLVRADDIERLTIADRNESAARELASRLDPAGQRVDVVAVDALDHRAVVDAMRGYDVAASALGPFYIFESKLVKAAVEAGVDYASICDDWSAARDAIEGFGEAAQRDGRTIVTGLGASPGLTNLGVQYYAEQMDHVRKVDISVYQPLDAGGGEAVLRHMLFIMTGDVAVCRGGEVQMVPACTEKRTVEFPKFGAIDVWNMGHAEPVTIPRSFPDVEECNFFMGYGRGSRAFVWPAKKGLFSHRRITDAVVRTIVALERLSPSEPAAAAVRIDIAGEKDGKPIRKLACGTGEMRAITGHSLSVGALMLGRRELLNEDGGVVPPEVIFDARKFLDGMKVYGFQAFEDLAMERPLEI